MFIFSGYSPEPEIGDFDLSLKLKKFIEESRNFPEVPGNTCARKIPIYSADT